MMKAKMGSTDDVFAEIDAMIDGRVLGQAGLSGEGDEGGGVGEFLSWLVGNNDKNVPWKKARLSKQQGSLSQTKFNPNELVESINTVMAGGF